MPVSIILKLAKEIKMCLRSVLKLSVISGDYEYEGDDPSGDYYEDEMSGEEEYYYDDEDSGKISVFIFTFCAFL